MTTDALDPVIHAPARLRIVATLAALPDGDALGLTRLQDVAGLAPASLVTQLRELEDAGYVRGEKAGDGGSLAAVALARPGREALDRYAAALRRLLAGQATGHRTAPQVRAGDADRDATAAALCEHFAHGRLTLDELNTRLAATLAASTHGELAQLTGDLPEVTVAPARASRSRGKKERGSS